MISAVLERPGPVALTLDRPVPESLALNRPGLVSIVLQLVGDRPDTGDDTARILRTLTSATRGLTGSQLLTAQIGRTLPARSVSLIAGQYLTAQVSRTVSPATRAISAYQPSVAAITRTVPAATRSLVGDTTGSAFIMRSVPAATRSLTATQYLTASITRTVVPATRSLIGILTLTGSISRTISSATRSASASQYVTGAISRAANAATRGASAGQYLTGAMTRTAGTATRSLSATQILTGATARTMPTPTRSLTASITLTGAVSRSISSATRSLAGSQDSPAAIARTVASASRALAATQTLTGAISRSRSAATRSLSASGTLWTPANLTVAPLVIMDAATLTWSGSNFSGGTNTGSLGGSFTSALGTPTKAAADINGFDAIAFAANSGIRRASVATPAGNKTLFYVSKRTGNPPGGVFLGAIMTQSSTTPGWSFFDEINVSTTPSGGHAVVPGDVGGIGWPSGTTVINKDVVAHPPTDDSTYHINIGKIGTAHLWRYDGTALTPTGSSDNSIAGVTADLTIGTSAVGQNFNGNIAYTALLEDPSSPEIEKMEGWAAWKYGLTSKLASGHPYKSSPPLV